MFQHTIFRDALAYEGSSRRVTRPWSLLEPRLELGRQTVEDLGKGLALHHEILGNNATRDLEPRIDLVLGLGLARHPLLVDRKHQGLKPRRVIAQLREPGLEGLDADASKQRGSIFAHDTEFVEESLAGGRQINAPRPRVLAALDALPRVSSARPHEGLDVPLGSATVFASKHHVVGEVLCTLLAS